MSADSAEDDPEAANFLTSIGFLIGEDPSGGSFLLVVGMVTIVFLAVFQFTLPEPISLLLSGIVLTVAAISFIMGAILDTLGYFDTSPEAA
ncbi:hypothetical protein [Halodesulfurarchaeum sp.]|uniref:hypothetical protein n=1 Tax=Halodesulfurarchaeum sp. TaxID=1980530 RepID=UPI002FC2DAA7